MHGKKIWLSIPHRIWVVRATPQSQSLFAHVWGFAMPPAAGSPDLQPPLQWRTESGSGLVRGRGGVALARGKVTLHEAEVR